MRLLDEFIRSEISACTRHIARMRMRFLIKDAVASVDRTQKIVEEHGALLGDPVRFVRDAADYFADFKIEAEKQMERLIEKHFKEDSVLPEALRQWLREEYTLSEVDAALKEAFHGLLGLVPHHLYARLVFVEQLSFMMADPGSPPTDQHKTRCARVIISTKPIRKWHIFTVSHRGQGQ